MKLGSAAGALWLSSIPRGPNGQPRWLIKIDRATGARLGDVNTPATHGMDVLPDGDLLSAPPSADQSPLWEV